MRTECNEDYSSFGCRRMNRTKKLIGILFVSIQLIMLVQAQETAKPEVKETLHAKADERLPVYRPVKGLAGPLRIVSPDKMETLLKYWVEDFQKLYPNIIVEMVPKGTGTGGIALTTAVAELLPIAREIPPDEEREFEQKLGYKPLAVRVAGGSYRTPDKALAIAFFVNKQNPIDKLTFAQLDAIYSSTRLRGYREVKTWGDVGAKGEWKDKPIHLWGLIRPGGKAGIVVSGNIPRLLSNRIMKGGEYREGINERTTVGAALPAFDVIAQEIARDPYAIGYAGFNNELPGIKTIALAEASGGPFYKGTFEEVASQRYPLSRVIYIYVNRLPGKPLDPKVLEFLKFVLSRQGQQDVEKEGIFLPLPLNLVRQERSLLK